MKLQEINEVTNHQITGGSEHLWTCYPESHSLDYLNEFASMSVVFNKKTQEIYEATVCIETGPLRDCRPYRWLNPDYKEAYFKECKKNKVKKNIAWDDVKFIDLETEEDFLQKAQAMFEGRTFDTRIQVPLELEDDVLLQLCKEAHKRDITLNQMVELLLRTVIEEDERKKLEKDLAVDIG